jgi:hypothetical protein
MVLGALAFGQGRDLGTVIPGDALRAVVIGDFGYAGSGSGQQNVLHAIRESHAVQPFRLGITVGDNFYPSGVSSVSDSKWKSVWEAGYTPLGFPFYAALGNHDYQGNEQAQVDYSAQSQSWRMPFRYYTFAAGPVRFFALDTDEGTTGIWSFGRAWSDAQASWLEGELRRHAAARWKVVYGHHPIQSDGHHGDTRRLRDKLLPILANHKVHAYVAGHEHELQMHVMKEPRTGVEVEQWIAGGGGKDLRSVTARRAKFARSAHGFLTIEANGTELKLRLVGTDGKALYP